MKSFEIAIFDNVNVTRLQEMLDGLKSLGCSIEIIGGKYRIKYEDELAEDVEAFFDYDYLKNKK